MAEVSIRDYLDIRIKSLEDKIDSLSAFNAQHFQLSELAIKKAEESMTIRLNSMNKYNDRIQKLEMSGSFSAGKMWMVMATFAAVPTIIALVAFIRSFS